MAILPHLYASADSTYFLAVLVCYNRPLRCTGIRTEDNPILEQAPNDRRTGASGLRRLDTLVLQERVSIRP